MSYTSWFLEHGSKHQKIVAKLKDKGLSKSDIIKYFEFDNMVEKEPSFCYLYAENKKCHDVDYLNCYLCACPLFRFDSNGIKKVGDKTLYSYCEVNSKHGVHGEFGEAIHLDCTNCSVPHGKKYIEKNYNEDWLQVMNSCDLGDS